MFTLASGSAAVTALIGSSPVRFWPFDRAPQKGTAAYGVPYAVHQLVYGSPENALACAPDIDSAAVQVDSYASTASEAREVSNALQNSFESSGYAVAYNGELKDTPTGLYRVSVTYEFLVYRNQS